MPWLGQDLPPVLSASHCYVFYGRGGLGDGERRHRHTVDQVFVILQGRVLLEQGRIEQVLVAPAVQVVRSQVEHGLRCLEPDTVYASYFGEWNSDGTLHPIDHARIAREQVPSLTPDEAAEWRQGPEARQFIQPQGVTS